MMPGRRHLDPHDQASWPLMTIGHSPVAMSWHVEVSDLYAAPLHAQLHPLGRARFALSSLAPRPFLPAHIKVPGGYVWIPIGTGLVALQVGTKVRIGDTVLMAEQLVMRYAEMIIAYEMSLGASA